MLVIIKSLALAEKPPHERASRSMNGLSCEPHIVGIGHGAGPVVLRGDWHSTFVTALTLDIKNPQAPVVATEFVTPSLSSNGDQVVNSPLYGPMLAENPHIQFFDGDRRGDLRCDVTPARWHTDMRYVRHRAPCGCADYHGGLVCGAGRRARGAARLARVGPCTHARSRDRRDGDWPECLPPITGRLAPSRCAIGRASFHDASSRHILCYEGCGAGFPASNRYGRQRSDAAHFRCQRRGHTRRRPDYHASAEHERDSPSVRPRHAASAARATTPASLPAAPTGISPAPICLPCSTTSCSPSASP